MEGFIQKVKEAVQNELGDLYEITETEDEEAIISIAKRIVDTIKNCEKSVIDADFVEGLVGFDRVKDNIIFRIINKDTR